MQNFKYYFIFNKNKFLLNNNIKTKDFSYSEIYSIISLSFFEIILFPKLIQSFIKNIKYLLKYNNITNINKFNINKIKTIIFISQITIFN